MPIAIANRDFLTAIHTRETVPGEEFFVISRPVLHDDGRVRPHFVRGRYESIERVRFLRDSSQIEWITATSSDPGGSVPNFLVERTMPSKIAEDVPSYIKWIKEMNWS